VIRTAAEIEPFGPILRELKAIHNTILKREEKEKEKEREENLILRYPRREQKELPAGTTVIDLKTMNVTLPTGTTEKVFPPTTVKRCKSAAIYFDKEIEVDFKLDGRSTYVSTLSPYRVRFASLDFDRVEIITSIPTMFAIEMATAADAVPLIQPLPTTIGTPEKTSQKSIKFEDDITVSGRSVGIVKLKDPVTKNDYVVPSGYRLIVGISIISSELPVWTHTYLVVTPGMIGDYRYKGRGQIEFPAYAATIVDAGTTPTVYIFNEDEESLDFSIAINGVEEKT